MCTVSSFFWVCLWSFGSVPSCSAPPSLKVSDVKPCRGCRRSSCSHDGYVRVRTAFKMLRCLGQASRSGIGLERHRWTSSARPSCAPRNCLDSPVRPGPASAAVEPRRSCSQGIDCRPPALAKMLRRWHGFLGLGCEAAIADLVALGLDLLPYGGVGDDFHSGRIEDVVFLEDVIPQVEDEIRRQVV